MDRRSGWRLARELGQAAAVLAVAYVLTQPPRPRRWRWVEAGSMKEEDLERGVRDLMELLGLRLAYHSYDSRRSAPGFPDWVIIGPGGVLFRELKSSDGRVSRAQQRWLRAFQNHGLDAAVWRPEDLKSGRIRDELLALTKREC